MATIQKTDERSRPVTVGLWGMAAIALCGIGIGAVSMTQLAKQGEGVAKNIPLKEVYTNPQQDGLNNLKELDERGKIQFNEFGKEKLDLSNIFLIRAQNISQGVVSTYSVLTGKDGPAFHVPPKVKEGEKIMEKKGPGDYWLVLYCGVTGLPLEWSVKSVRRTDRIVEIRCHPREKNGVVQPVILHQFVWVPLGQLEEGTYTLRWIDDSNGELILSRREAVPVFRW